MAKDTLYYLGLDLGQASDYTALAVLRQSFQNKVAYYDGVYLRRFSLGDPYPAIVDEVARMVATPEISEHEYYLIPDMTGVGRPVVDMLERINQLVYPITITGGSLAHYADGVDHVPKCELVTVLQVLLQNQRLRFAASLPEIKTLVDEMLNFRVKISLANHELYGAWREGEHDDLVLAVAMAAWKGEQMAKGNRSFIYFL